MTAPMTSPPEPTPASFPAATADLQAEALIEAIERQVAEQRAAVRAGAATEAVEIRRRARDKARRQMRRAIDEMRAAQSQQMQQVHAELETAARRRASARALEVLAQAGPAWPDALRQRWQDGAARSLWLTAQLAQARARLPAAGWSVRHPAAWTEAEARELRAQLQALGVVDAALQPDADLAAGLVIEVGGARLDSSPTALLADRARVEAMLLAALDPAREQGAGDA